MHAQSCGDMRRRGYAELEVRAFVAAVGPASTTFSSVLEPFVLLAASGRMLAKMKHGGTQDSENEGLGKRGYHGTGTARRRKIHGNPPAQVRRSGHLTGRSTMSGDTLALAVSGAAAAMISIACGMPVLHGRVEVVF